ncbi:MAG TPA: hypothetical protein VLM37_13575 [Fibrobacteraceae bacterium]|nr:hypothetical protein [Fibrobacteraceae bacterium]
MIWALLSSCKDDQAPQESVAPVATPKAESSQASDFIPPSDGLLTPEIAKKYVEASAALLLLTDQWVDRLEKTNDNQEKMLILSGFESARNQLCRKIGLSGSRELDWISSEALKNPKNQEVAEKAGIGLASSKGRAQ